MGEPEFLENSGAFYKDWVADLECNKEKPDDQFKPYGATPGHGIEWSRLITQWALSTFKDDKDGAQKYLDLAENLYCRAVDDAWNADGAPGIVYTTDWEGKPVVHDRMHWTLAEAINTSSVLYHVTGKQRYADDYAEFMQYLDESTRSCKRLLVPSAGSEQRSDRNRMAGKIRPVPRTAGDADSALSGGSVHRSGSKRRKNIIIFGKRGCALRCILFCTFFFGIIAL